jgi:hypothetical protein
MNNLSEILNRAEHTIKVYDLYLSTIEIKFFEKFLGKNR